ncbi:MAG: TIGR00725 family protein [Actinomycetia bacterium]|nr:TIGR00725 family protein [Actinomycetes bacterium]
MYISVIGASKCGKDLYKLAYDVGREIAKRKAILICGGLGGVMDASAKGAKEVGGMTVGILPGDTRIGASKYLNVSLPTGMGEARNVLVIKAADVVIAIGGEYGTLSEIAHALKMNIPVVGLKTWDIGKDEFGVSRIIKVDDPIAAVEKAYKLAKSKG